MKNRHKILLAEDEAALGMIVKESLESRDFEVLFCDNGATAMDLYKAQAPDLLVLDVMMPVKDGFTLAKEIRRLDSTIPIIFLTARSRTEDVLEGFGTGGNDYLKKPFSMEELIVRVKELLNRSERKALLEEIPIGNYVFNYPQQILELGGQQSLLTHREAEVLRRLTEKPNQLVDKTLLLNEVWGNDDFYSARSLDVFISKLRKKLGADPLVKILNVRGYGYKLIF